MSPLVFLDIDGVLNCGAFLSHGGDPDDIEVTMYGERLAPSAHIDPARVARLQRFVEAVGAEVVLSTSWRCLVGETETATMLRRKGLAAAVVGSTPRIYDAPRGDEIAAWLLNHPGRAYVVLDDDHDAGVGHGGRFVHVADGLEDEHVTRAASVLAAVQP